MNTFGLLFHPVGGCRRINDHPTWLLPLVVVSLLGLIAAILIMPFGMKLTMFKISGLPADQIKHSMDMVILFTYAGIALTPIVLLIKWAIVAVIIYLIGIILNAEARFKSLFALIAHANVIIVLSSVANALVLRFKDPQSILHPFDMNIIGLHRFFDPAST
ncbi:MAG: YIP1 family protein, partial [Candidatus Delongbacteria bacterium]|nr:YIP1 family protein [Candidatus Delongbacteria bacterium]